MQIEQVYTKTFVDLYVSEDWDKDGLVTIMLAHPEMQFDVYQITQLHHHLTKLLESASVRHPRHSPTGGASS